MKNIYEKIIEIQKGSKNAVVCTVVNTKGSTPRKVGAKMVVYESGKIFGTIGGGELEKAVIKNALEQIKENEPKIFRHDLLHQHGMCCGGTVDIYIEPIRMKNKLYIFGAGHTGQALAKYAVNFQFEGVLIDDRRIHVDFSQSVAKQRADYFKGAIYSITSIRVLFCFVIVLVQQLRASDQFTVDLLNLLLVCLY